MKITEPTNNDNNVSRFTELLDTGNLVPPIWYHKLLRECGKSDCTAIAILSELVLLHCDQGSKEFQLNFKYFKDKFNFGLSQVKDAVIRLEKLGLVTRSPRTVMILGRSFANEMFLVLNIEKVLDLSKRHDLKKFQQSIRNNNSPTEISSSDENNKKYEIEKIQCVRNNFDTPSVEISSDSTDKTEKTEGPAGNAYLPSAEISTDSENKMAKSGDFAGNSHLPSVEISADSENKMAKLRDSSGKEAVPSVEISSVHNIDLSKNNNISRYIDRSNESSFFKIPDEINEKEDIEENEQTDTLVTNSLQSEEVTKALSLDGAKTKTELKGLSHSQPVPIPISEKQSSVITKIRSKFSFFGKKLSEFHPLSNEDRDVLVAKSGRDFDLNFINQLMLRISDKYPGHKFYNKNCVMNYMTKLLAHELRDAVKVSNGCFRFKNNQEDRQIQPQEILRTESELYNKSANQFVSAVSANGNSVNSDNSSHSTNYGNNYTGNNILTPAASITSKETDSIWSRVRCSLIEHFRDGEWLDRNWFSKLEAIYDHDSQKLTLKAPTKLIRDRVWQHYGYLIERYCTDVNYQLVGVES